MRRWLGVSALFLIAAFAGCLDSDEEPHDHDEHGDHMEPKLPDTPPTAAISALMIAAEVSGDGNGTDGNSTDANATAAPAEPVTGNLTAAIPFDVEFQFAFTDINGDNLTYAFDADGDGTNDTEGQSVADNGTYPDASFLFSYTANGTFNATLSVSDGSNTTTAVFVVDAIEANTTGDAIEPIVFTGSGLNAPQYGCVTQLGTLHAFDGALAGVWMFETTGADITEWYAGGSYDHGGDNSGTIPLGMDGVTACSSTGGSYTITLYHPDFPPVAAE